ncbi:thymidylate synthase, partial [Arthrospira platensis SPKY1]|nr:thymidylate synthase [Arthrospira platensis SPKY1]
MSSWQDISLENSALPPCHYSMQIVVLPDGYFDLAWNQRSVDVVLGLPYNILSYAVFMELVAKRFRLKPHYLYGNLGHTHIYSNHYDAVYEMFARYDEVSASIDDSFKTASERIAIDGIKELWEYQPSDIMLVDYDPMPKLSNATP